MMKIFIVYITYQYDVDDAAVFAGCVVIGQECLLQVSQALDDAVDHLIDAHDLLNHGTQLREKCVRRVGAVENVAAAFFAFEETGLGQLVQFFTNGIARHAEFFGELPQIGPCLRVQEEAHEQLHPGLG